MKPLPPQAENKEKQHWRKSSIFDFCGAGGGTPPAQGIPVAGSSLTVSRLISTLTNAQTTLGTVADAENS